MKTVIIGNAAFAALALTWANSIGAHHSESMFAPTPMWVHGKVVEFARTNPHVVVTLEEVTPEGQIRRWDVEGPTVSQLNGKGVSPDFLVAGDQIEFCAFPRRQRSTYRPPGAPPFVHGQVLVAPDGNMMLWGTYGKLTNCVRPDDESQVWVNFLSAEDPAYAEWCWKSARIPTREESRDLVDEIDNIIGDPCK